MNAFMKSQFNDYPLVWIFYDRGSNSKINRIKERALQLVRRGSGRELENLRENHLTNYQLNLQLLVIEIYKTNKQF